MRRFYLMAFLCMSVCSFLFAQDPFPQDSLTCAVCDNQEQIVSRRINEWRISYYMGETELNMKTMTGFLSLNSASKPLYNQYLFSKIASRVLFIGGVGLIIVDSKFIDSDFPYATLGGIGLSVTGIVVSYKSNNTFRLAIRAYNRDVCHLR